MSLTTIPNQPINFADPEVYAKCRDIEPELTVSLDDKMVFQFLQDRCPDAAQYLDPISPSDWIDNPGWTIGAGLLSLVTENGLSDVNESSFVATIGTTYEVEVFVQSVQGDGVFVMVGGVQRVVNSPGLHKWVITAEVLQGARATAVSDNSAIVITSFKVWEANRSFTVAFVGADTTVDYNPVDDPEFFQYIGQHVVFIAPIPEGIEGCFHMELRDECLEEAVVYCSQSIRPIGCEGTLMFRVCLDSAGLGFAPGYFTVRLPASLTNPVWEYETAQERLSNGFINTYYIDRQSVRSLSIESVSKHLHPFLAAMVMFDHFYIGEVEYSIDADTYQPSYGEGQTGTGSVTLNVRKKHERMRRVLCDDLGPGCNPANDPICPEANAIVGTEYSEGTLFAFVEVFSNLGFFVSEAQWFLNGVEQTAALIGGTPGKYALGEVDPGDTVRVVFVDNQSAAECTDDRGTFEVQSPCESETSLSFVFPEGSAGTLYGATTSGYFTALYPELDFLETIESGSGSQISATVCVFPSDIDGNPLGQWTGLGIVFADPFDNSVVMDLSNLDGVTLSEEIDTGISAPPSSLTFIDGGERSSIEIPNLAGSNESLLIDNCSDLEDVIIPSGVKFKRIVVVNCPSLTEASVDALCNALDATATGQASTISAGVGEGPAPTAASAANRAAYIANGNTLSVFP
jgi:hypothetical protein